MDSHTWPAMGTAWTVVVDGQKLSTAIRQELEHHTAEFETRFSRFLPQTEATQFRSAAAGQYQVSSELATLLLATDRLRQLTAGAHDPAVGGLLELAGYDAEYSFEVQQHIDHWRLPHWKLTETTLKIDGPVVFDLGGTAKGYWIDQLSHYLLSKGFSYHLVDGGGDMYATSKGGDKAWQIAIEWPNQPDKALGTVAIKNQGLAISDIFKRQWGEWHHVVDISNRLPEKTVVSCAALAATAWAADQVTAGLTVTPTSQHTTLAQAYAAEYFVITNQHQLQTSANWPGTFF